MLLDSLAFGRRHRLPRYFQCLKNDSCRGSAGGQPIVYDQCVSALYNFFLTLLRQQEEPAFSFDCNFLKRKLHLETDAVLFVVIQSMNNEQENFALSIAGYCPLC